MFKLFGELLLTVWDIGVLVPLHLNKSAKKISRGRKLRSIKKRRAAKQQVKKTTELLESYSNLSKGQNMPSDDITLMSGASIPPRRPPK